MNIFTLDVSKYGLNIDSYFGGVYIETRTFIIVGVLLVVLRVAKLIRKAVR
jgi:hypothetical protein